MRQSPLDGDRGNADGGAAEGAAKACFAHTLPNRPDADWERLEDHLRDVAGGRDGRPGAAGFAGVFEGADLARVAALWHDLGKYAPQFQAYLRASAAGRATGRVDHATAGALLASRSARRGAAGVLAFVIAGHHTGLPDLGSPQSDDGSCLAQRLRANKPETIAAIDAAPDAIKGLAIPAMPAWVTPPTGPPPLRLSMFIRMLFSCLIDADRLATERFCSPEGAADRSAAALSIAELRATLDEHIEALAGAKGSRPSPVDAVRAELLADCRRAAAHPPGLFSLTAPTGSGKTLSSMAF